MYVKDTLYFEVQMPIPTTSAILTVHISIKSDSFIQQHRWLSGFNQKRQCKQHNSYWQLPFNTNLTLEFKGRIIAFQAIGPCSSHGWRKFQPCTKYRLDILFVDFISLFSTRNTLLGFYLYHILKA